MPLTTRVWFYAIHKRFRRHILLHDTQLEYEGLEGLEAGIRDETEDCSGKVALVCIRGGTEGTNRLNSETFQRYMLGEQPRQLVVFVHAPCGVTVRVDGSSVEHYIIYTNLDELTHAIAALVPGRKVLEIRFPVYDEPLTEESFEAHLRAPAGEDLAVTTRSPQ